MSDDTINIEINGESVSARRGQMLIEVTDRHEAYVPRFCYHEKLSVAANCRMCLVEVENAPKPLPACATPVTDGMKVFTRSPIAISAQKATMEFLLINHPLDCPICDQGGECELQDLAMGFGRDVSRYADQKRVVKDKDLGPLVSTDMTRCIHCTRCVRFGQEIAGLQELGTTGRSEQMEIGTYIERSVDHELSGNIIDLCPVGALNNKPYRFGARAWEMEAKPLVSPHDCAGSNLYGHVLRGTLKRVVPQDNEAINETWISDRDRFGYEGVYATDRLTSPLLKKDQEWFDVSWTEALAATRESLLNDLRDEGDALGVLVSPNATLEEMYLLNRLTRHLGSQNLDHRLRMNDFSDQASDPLWPSLGTSIAELDNQDGVLVIGSNLRMEVPIIAHRIRKAAVTGAAVGFVNPVPYEIHFPRAAYVDAPLEHLVKSLAGVVIAAAELKDSKLPAPLAEALKSVEIQDTHRDAAGVLLNKERALILLGQLAMRHPHYADIRRLAAALADLTGARLGYLPEGANAVGAALAGVLPHRGPGGRTLDSAGLDAYGMLASPRSVYVLFGLEPDHDLADSALAEQALKAADTVICFTPFVTERLLECADVLLPIGTFAETAGTFVNVEGRWQSFAAAASLVGDARAGWRVLRVLGNELDLPVCEYQNAAEISDALASEIGHVEANNDYQGSAAVSLKSATVDATALDVPMYAVDAVVRRGTALQKTRVAIETRKA
ncbi:MAG: NADH-quinone oxidoreductase subunit NuoG [Gammaproteobacteria bacterium]